LEGGAAAGGASEGGAAAGGASVFIRCPNNARIETITPVTTKKCMPHPGLSAPVWGGNPMAIFGSAIMAMTQNYCPFCFYGELAHLAIAAYRAIRLRYAAA